MYVNNDAGSKMFYKMQIMMFRRNTLPPSSRLKYMDKLQEKWSLSSMGEEGEMKPVWAKSKDEHENILC
jgi:hypothetical protein